MKFRYPVNYVAITQEFKKGKHFGIDLGWNSQYGGKNQPIYASQDGEVVVVKDNDYSGKSWGNYVKIYHGNNIYTLYAHLNHGLKVKKGQKVKMGDLLGYMGTTGISTGNHLHFEVYDGGASTSYRINPQPITYVYPDQNVSVNSTNDVLYYNENETTYQGEFPILPRRGYFKNGDTGLEVKKLQKLLNWLNETNLVIDGIIGKKTLNEVGIFQRNNNLVIDKLFGEKSLAKAKTIKK